MHTDGWMALHREEKGKGTRRGGTEGTAPATTSVKTAGTVLRDHPDVLSDALGPCNLNS